MRRSEIDITKGLALILMIIYHIFFMIDFFNINNFEMSSGILGMISSLSHNTFILMAGVNLYLSYKKNKDEFYKKQNKRVTKVASGALFMNIFSYFAFGKELYIKFGILHFMTVAIIISYFIVKSKILSLVISILFYILSLYVKNNGYMFDSCKNYSFLCSILGIYNKHNMNFQSLDHFAIIHTYGLFAFGIFLGYLLYENKKSKKNKKKNKNQIINEIEKLGQNTFNIYILHWPILYIIFYIYSLILTKKIEN